MINHIDFLMSMGVVFAPYSQKDLAEYTRLHNTKRNGRFIRYGYACRLVPGNYGPVWARNIIMDPDLAKTSAGRFVT